jgi:hypothetical protein
MRFIKLNYNIRNEMAHWGWGVTDTLPDALIIFEPVNSKKFTRSCGQTGFRNGLKRDSTLLFVECCCDSRVVIG